MLEGGEVGIALQEYPFHEVLRNRLNHRCVTDSVPVPPEAADRRDPYSRQAKVAIELPSCRRPHGDVMLSPLTAERDPRQPMLVCDGESERRIDEAVGKLVDGRDPAGRQRVVVLPGGAKVGSNPA